MERVWRKGDCFPNGARIWEIIDSGGMGTVYLIKQDGETEIRVAKTYKAEFFKDPEQVQKFLFEAKVLIDLPPHPNIVTADVVLRIEEIPFIIMEYIPKGNLASYIRSCSVEKALLYAIQICEGMAYLHGSKGNENAGIVHCDLKPSNILIGERGNVKVSDFGLSKILRTKQNHPDQTKNGGRIMGTAAYMSPEHFLGMDYVDFTSDIYSFGVVLYELLAKRLPFEKSGNNVQELLDNFQKHHQNSTPIKLREINNSLPISIEHLVMSCLEKSPGNRPQKFGEIKGTLIDIYSSLTGNTYFTVKENSLIETAPSRITRSYYHIGDYDGAIKMADEALLGYLSDDQRVEVLNLKGQALESLGKYEDSIVQYDLALKIAPEAAFVWNNKGGAYNWMKKFDEGIECLEKSIAFDPNDWAPYHNMGVAIDMKGNHEASLEWFDRALKINPVHVNSLASKGNVLQKLERFDDAIEYEQRALAINPRDANAINNLCVIYQKKGDLESALRYADQIIDLDLRLPLAWNNKAKILFQAGQYDNALDTIEKGFEYANDKVEILKLKVIILLNLLKIRAEPKYHELTHQTLLRILEIEPEDEFARGYSDLFQSIMLSSEENIEAAEESDSKGEYLLNIGQIEKAIPFFKRSIELNPQFMSPYNNLV